MFEREDWTAFRSLGTLSQKAGVPPERLPKLIAKELADNALDASGSCRVGLIAGNAFYVEDDGPGIPGDDREIASLFSIRRPLTSSKVLRLPTRGALGNGLRVVAGTVLACGGTLHVWTRGRGLLLTPKDDGSTDFSRIDDCDSSGTRVRVGLRPPLFIDRPALAWAESAVNLAVGERYTGKTSPHWYDPDAFYELCQSAGRRTARELIAEFDGCAEPKAGKIASEFRNRPANGLDRGESAALLRAARQLAKEVSAGRLGQIGEWTHLPSSYAVSRRYLEIPGMRGELPARLAMVLECWAEFSDKTGIQVTVNRSPITGDVRAWSEKNKFICYGCGLDQELDLGRRPVSVRLNIEIPHMPITSDGKAPNLGPFNPLVLALIKKTVNHAKRLIPAKADGSPARSQKDVILATLPAAIAKASGDGAYRFSLRQLFYAVRPVMLAELGRPPEYDYFASVLAEHEAVQGHDLPGMYRDARGTLYHPHTCEEIPLGTLNIEQYSRPEWTFNKILYCEKEGFFPLLKDVKWPERHDCALLSSKGYASRAARDVLDLLGDGDEEISFYAIHDADAEGTMIYQALQEATTARPGRRVKIVNLGLDRSEAVAMGLQVEAVARKGDKVVPAASYTSAEDREWFQSNRVELNAMTTPEFLAWLDAKFAGEVGKLVPPAPVLAADLERRVRDGLRDGITREVIRQASVPSKVALAMASRAELLRDSTDRLPARVSEELASGPAEPWGDAVARVAGEIIEPPPAESGNLPLLRKVD